MATAALVLSTAITASAADPLLKHPVRVRIAWGGPAEAAGRWSGRIAVEGGTLGDMQVLGMEADTPASIWQENGEIRIGGIRTHRFDGVDVALTASDESRLKIELSSDATQSPVTAEVSLAKALREPFQLALDAHENTLLVERAPGDDLQIETDREVLIFAPRETFSFRLRPAVDGIEPSTTIDVQTRLTPARGGQTIWTDKQRLPVPVDGDVLAALTVPLPADEGVYTIDVAVTRPPGFRDRFLPASTTKPLAERRFQVVVMGPGSSTGSGQLPAAPEWQTVLEIDPANPRWWQRLPDWTRVGRLPGIAPRPLGSIRAGAVDLPLGRFVELPPTPSGGEPHWQAYPLPIEQAALPHLLEVEYPADQEQHIGLSILEPNAAGRAVPIGRDSGVYVEGLGQSERAAKHVHRLVFWPRTNSPLLLVTNQHPTAAARFGRIRVLRRPGGLDGAEGLPPWRSAERLVAAYVAGPLVPETFGATEGLDPPSGQSLDDWQTFYEGATRLAEYLQFAGYNAAATGVLADGSTTYPSRRLLATPLHDTGRMVTAGGLPAHDALELTLRVFDRRGLGLFPTLQLASPLAELEPLRRAADPKTSGLEWVGPDGRSWLDVCGTDRGLAPYYNLLDERVQQAVENVVREIVDRYRHHHSLAGLAVQLSANGFAELPGLEWGLDDQTIAQFERDTGIALSGDGPNRFAARQSQLLGEHLDAWRDWRAARVTQFYRRLAEIVQSGDSQRRLLLTTEQMLSRPQLAVQVRPNVLASLRIDRVLLDLGIDREALSAVPGVVVCATRFVEPGAPLVSRAINLQISEAFSAISQGGASSAATFYHRPARRRMASFDAKSPLDSYTLLVTQSLPDESTARRAYAMALDDGDPTLVLDGGELLPLGQEDALRGVRQILQQLPIGAATSTAGQQPVIVRRYVGADSTTLLVVNQCPWQAEAEVSLDLPQPAVMAPLVAASDTDATAPTPRTLPAGRQSWSLRLRPYDVQAVRITAPGIEVAQVRASVGDAARQELESRLADLGSRDLTAVSTYPGLANPGFEPAGGGGPVPGWQLATGESLGRPVAGAAPAAVELDATTPRAGKTCLYLSSGGDVATVQSNTFATPPTGQLAMTVFVRGENVDANTELRMVFEAEVDSQFYSRFAVVGGSSAQADLRRGGSASGDRSRPQPIDDQWVYYAFCVSDLPLDSRGQMRVRFELSGPGEVWIDDVQLYDLLFPLRFYAYSSQERLELVKLVLAATGAQKNGRLAECVRLLESYWPRFVTAYTPLGPPAIATQPPAAEPAPPPAAAEQSEDAPSMSQRVKQYLPSILRF